MFAPSTYSAHVALCWPYYVHESRMGLNIDCLSLGPPTVYIELQIGIHYSVTTTGCYVLHYRVEYGQNRLFALA